MRATRAAKKAAGASGAMETAARVPGKVVKEPAAKKKSSPSAGSAAKGKKEETASKGKK